MNLKESLFTLQAYKPNKKPLPIKLDANEANYNLSNLSIDGPIEFNRYPDSYASDLIRALAKTYNILEDQLLVGSGSSELLELTVKSFVNPNETVVSLAPSFVMYEKYAAYYNAKYKSFELPQNGRFDLEDFLTFLRENNPKLIFLATPNNPTGASISQKDIQAILKETDALLVLDEAYIEFKGESYSMIDQVGKYPNLLVARTFSKAYGLASLRVGYLSANQVLIDQLKRVKTPYSVSALSQELALKALNNPNTKDAYLQMIKTNKKVLQKQLEDKGFSVQDSDANFLYLQTSFPLASFLETWGIGIRAFPNNFYRITIPSDTELKSLEKAIKEIDDDENKR